MFGLQRVGAVYLSGDDARDYTVAAVFSGSVSPSWIDTSFLPKCGAVFTQCGGVNFEGPHCCRAPYSCVYQTASMFIIYILFHY